MNESSPVPAESPVDIPDRPMSRVEKLVKDIQERGLDVVQKEMLEAMNFDLLVPEDINPNVACAKCGSTRVRVYRPYGFFYHPEDNRCNDCLDNDEERRKHRGLYYPCIPDKEGCIWVDTPIETQRWWCSLPEKNPYKPIWDTHHQAWSSSLTKDFYLPDEVLKRLGKERK